MKKKIENNTVKACLVIFAVLLLVHGLEAICLRMDETIFGENFVNKLFGILLLKLILNILDKKWKDIGFTRSGIGWMLGFGTIIAAAAFLVAYGAEIIILLATGQSPRLGFFTTGFSLTGFDEIHTGAGFIVMCVIFNIINVIMEEGTFRGLFMKIAGRDHSFKFALFFQAILFGVWHIVTPLHNLIDGDIEIGEFIVLGIGYIILAGLMGIKWGLLRKLTGSLYAGMADHFFNNCIATNLLHVITDDGIDDMMIVRVLIAQLLSFTVVLIMYRSRVKRKADTRKNAVKDV